MTSLAVAGNVIGGLDSYAGVKDAAAQLAANPSDLHLIANYDAALANAAATVAAATDNGEIASTFAANAIIANINNLNSNISTMSLNDVESSIAAITGEVITLVGQGVSFYGVEEANVNPLAGGATITVGQVLNIVGFIVTAVGAGLDAATIANVAHQELDAAGISTDPNAIITPSGFSNSNFICDADNASTMFNMAVGDNTLDLQAPSITVTPGAVATVVVENAQDQALIISPGVNGSGMNVEISGGGNDITLKQGAAVTVNSTQANTIHNDVTGQDFTVSSGQISTSGGTETLSGGALNEFSVNGDGSLDVTMANSSGIVTGIATYSSQGALQQQVFYDPYSGRETQVNNHNADGSQVDHLFNVNGTQTATVYDAAGHETEYATFGANGMKTQDIFFDATTGRETQENDINADGSQIDWTFNANGSQNATVINATGHETEYATFGTNGAKTQDVFFDATSGRETQENDFNADGSQVDHLFNANGTQTAYVFNAAGHETEQASFGTNGKITQDLFYDATSGKLTQENDYNADGSQTDWTISANGTQNATVINAAGHETEYATFGTNGQKTQDVFFDATSGRETQENDINADGSQVDHLFNADGTQNAIVFNAAGHETEQASFGTNGKMTQDVFYDASTGRETQENDINADGSQIDHVFNTNGTQTAYVFNSAGHETEQANFGTNGKLTQDFVFDGTTGRELQETDYNADGSGVAHIFNPNGTQNAAVFDPNGHVSEYATFGANGQKTQDIFYDTSTGRETQENDFNPDGSAVAHIFIPDGSQTATVYNAAGHETEYAVFNTSGQKTDDYFYDGTTGRETEYNQYHGDGSMTAWQFNGDNSSDAIIFNGNGQELEYDSYNSSGQLTGFTQFTYGAGGGYNAVAYGPTGYELGWSDYGSNNMLISSGGGEYDFSLSGDYGSGVDTSGFEQSFENDFGYSCDFGF
ncbi:hypothetical protein AAGS40_18540 [Paraburkholderia sp. PREW-6R]|uniref:beta strand repeat-containing protein n=1 Tax=Paraburkholderia sp. PREW-6R TaxID=3141544 RepID=UPI0031F581D4